MAKLTIDDVEIEVPDGITVLQACEMAGVEIPRFCYHERLSVAGNCRMCLVEVAPGPPKPAASCALPVGDGMTVKTNSPMVKKAREGVMEFLLINHPLDCPICDQGGECDLQDQAMAYGVGNSRYDENKRAVRDKELGPLVKTEMTRCIHCTRCIRFATEVAGIEELGATGRGESMEVGTYVEKALTSELSANIIDLCPVGALTSKPYAFTARPWELTRTETIDVMDAVGSNIRVDSRGSEILRVLPVLNEDINEEWISDKTRYACDGLKRQRLDTPYVRREGALQAASWDEAFAAIADNVKDKDGSKIAAIAGDLVDCEAMMALSDLMDGLGSPHIDCRQDGAKLDAAVRGSYIFNTTIAGIEEADACLLVGTNPRIEAALVNARIRKRWLRGGFTVGAVGPRADLTYPHEYLGAGPQTLKELAEGSHAFCDVLRNAEKPLVIVGQGALARADGGKVLSAARKIADGCGLVSDGWNGFNVLHTAAGRVGGLDIGFVPGVDGLDVAGILEGAANGEIETVYLLGADEIDTSHLEKAFVIYQGHHGDAGAHCADVILPGAAYTEKNATYVNTEGRVQRAWRAVFPPGDAREDWTIIRALSDVLGKTLRYDDLAGVRRRMALQNAVFEIVGDLRESEWTKFGEMGVPNGDVFDTPVANFYMTDPISRASETMAACTKSMAKTTQEKTGTDG
ncbi:MAG: NADH-quinone oxidoreductase subunit G [Rhodospirillaceae bacterium]|nr:NADH-quinone oxidoreductase subunit G [Rhodospirillaceae bacterium]|tara:strand:+ start:14648 stop:16714 length:2067 start_codon:yes stop_codon:yes gene_type:complete